MQELIINQQAGTLDGNFEEIKAALAEKLEAYKSLAFTEDTKKDAKETVAELRKAKKELEDQVKAVKKEWMKPFDDFNAKAFELYSLYDEPIRYISDQIDAFELKRKQEKQEHIRELYAEIVPEADIAELIPLNKIYNPKWENATTNDKAIKAEIFDFKTKAKEGMATIKNFHSDMEERAVQIFLTAYDLTAALTFLTNYENEKREILAKEREQARQEEEARIRAEERAKIDAEQRQEVELAAAKLEAQNEAIEALIPDVSGEAKQHTYIITLTDDGKEKLEKFMDSVGIDYEELMF